jgi:hypothetical protein
MSSVHPINISQTNNFTSTTNLPTTTADQERIPSDVESEVNALVGEASKVDFEFTTGTLYTRPLILDH